MACATYVISRLALSPINFKSPYELMFEEKPNVKHFKDFGSPCYVHVLTSHRSKLDTKLRKYVFICYDEKKKGWKCMAPISGKFVVSRDAFDEACTYFAIQGVVIDLSDGDKVEQVSTSSNAHTLSKSSFSSLVREINERGSKNSSLEDRRYQGEDNIVVVKMLNLFEELQGRLSYPLGIEMKIR